MDKPRYEYKVVWHTYNRNPDISPDRQLTDILNRYAKDGYRVVSVNMAHHIGASYRLVLDGWDVVLEKPISD